MFCSKCGTQNEEGSKVCSKCGEPLSADVSANEEKTVVVSSNEQKNTGGVRKAIKADAKKRVAGSLILATLVYIVVIGLISSVINNNDSTALSTVISLVISLIAIIFSYSLLIAGFELVNGRSVTFSDVFTKPFKNGKNLGYVILLSVIVLAISFVCGILMVIPILGLFVAIGLVVAIVYFVPTIEAFMCLLADPDEEDMNFDIAFKRSLELSKGNRVEYWGVMLSFIGWYLLGFLTLGILYIWLTPYAQITTVNLYRKWAKKESFIATDGGMSNGAVIGLTAGGCGCGCIVVFVFFVGIIAAAITALGVNIDNPEIQSFIEKYSTIDKNDPDYNVEQDLEDIFDQFETSYN